MRAEWATTRAQKQAVNTTGAASRRRARCVPGWMPSNRTSSSSTVTTSTKTLSKTSYRRSASTSWTRCTHFPMRRALPHRSRGLMSGTSRATPCSSTTATRGPDVISSTTCATRRSICPTHIGCATRTGSPIHLSTPCCSSIPIGRDLTIRCCRSTSTAMAVISSANAAEPRPRPTWTRSPILSAPSAAAYFDIGRAIGRAMAASPWRTAIIGSSSWGHGFLTKKNHWLYPDHPSDRKRLAELKENRLAGWRNFRREELEDAGQHELTDLVRACRRHVRSGQENGSDRLHRDLHAQHRLVLRSFHLSP